MSGFEGRWSILTVTLVSLCLAAMMFRGELADALVVRGDDLFIRNDIVGARARYERALWISPESAVALDRYMWASLVERTSPGIDQAIRRGTGFLFAHKDATIYFDRGLCFLREKKYRLAFHDFFESAALKGDPLSYVFAGWAAKRSGDRAHAAHSFHAALHVQPHYSLARLGLRGL